MNNKKHLIKIIPALLIFAIAISLTPISVFAQTPSVSMSRISLLQVDDPFAPPTGSPAPGSSPAPGPAAASPGFQAPGGGTPTNGGNTPGGTPTTNSGNTPGGTPTTNGGNTPGGTPTTNGGNTPGGPNTFYLQNPLNSRFNTVGGIVQGFLEIFSYLVILLAVLMLIWVGLQFILAQGKADRLKELKGWLLWIVIGVAVVIGARIIVTVVIKTLESTGVVSPTVIQNANNAIQGR